MAKTVTLNIRVNDEELEVLTQGLDELGIKFQETEEAVGGTTKKVKELGLNSKVITKLDQLTGGWASSVIDVATGLKDVVKGLNLTKAALIATGIGAFVVILGTIVAYWDDIKEAVTGVNVELQEQKELSDQINLSLERRNQLEKDNARFVDIRTKERLLRAKIAGASEEELTNIEREGLEERLRLAEEYAKKSDEILRASVGADEETFLKAQERQLKAYDDLAQARSALGLFNLEQQVPEEGKQGKREKESKVNPLTGEDMDAETERLSNHFNALFELDKANKDALQNSTDNALQRLLTSEQYAQAQRTANAEEESRIRQMIAEQEAQAKAQAFMYAAEAFSSASDLIGKETAAGKALAVASALISTYLSAQQAYLAAFNPVPTVASPFLGAAFAGVAVLSGLANVKNILAVKVPGQGGGGAGISGGSPSTPPAFNVVQNNPQNQLNQSLLEQNNQPVEAFVVDKNVTSAQEARRNKIESSSI